MRVVRSEPDYPEHAPRMRAWKAAHPDGEIIYIGPHWQAVIREGDDGLTVITRYRLGELMDKLESM